MDWNECAVFVRVVQAGSFSAAARQLGLPTSTVSTRVARLEKRLGVTLLQRTTRRLHLTEAGTLYFEHAATGLGHLIEAESAVTQAAGEPRGLLRVSAPADFGDQLLAELVHAMRRAAPQVGVELVLTDRQVDLVAEGVDVAIRAGALEDSTLVAKRVGVARWAVFASNAYLQSAAPIDAPQALRQHACIQFTPLGRDAWTLHSARGSVSVPLPAASVVNDIGVVRAMVRAGAGVALLPLFLCTHTDSHTPLVRVLPEWQARADPLHIVYPRQRFVPPKLRVFIDLAAQILPRWLEDE